MNRLRLLALKACGVRTDDATLFWGLPKLTGRGAITSRLRIGSYCGFNDGCVFDLEAPVTIGDHVSVGHEVRFLTIFHQEGIETAAPITVGDGTWLGARLARKPVIYTTRCATSGIGPNRHCCIKLVEQHYPRFLAELESRSQPLPTYVQREFDDYLKCGQLEHGFLRVRYEACHREMPLSAVLGIVYRTLAGHSITYRIALGCRRAEGVHFANTAGERSGHKASGAGAHVGLLTTCGGVGRRE